MKIKQYLCKHIYINMNRTYDELVEKNQRLEEEYMRLKKEYDKLGQMYDELSLSYEDALLLYDRAKESIRIESELQVASKIQMSMIPTKFPQLEGIDIYAAITPAKEVGGDLYGYLIRDDKLYFCVGDVSGKGVPASLFMAQATRLFRILASQGLMPAEICTYMNDALTEDNTTRMFVTFFLGLLDLKTGLLDFCNCGHTAPMVSDSSGNVDFLKITPSLPIGTLPKFKFKEEQIGNLKGKSLFVYTDGLNEAENLENEQFGHELMLDILRCNAFKSARQLIETMAAEVEKHRHGAEPNDDLAMMYLKIN